MECAIATTDGTSRDAESLMAVTEQAVLDLRESLWDGDAVVLEQAVLTLLRLHTGSALVSSLMADDLGLCRAVQRGHTAAMLQYMRLVLAAPEHLLSGNDKVRLLRGGGADSSSCVAVGIVNGRSEVLARFVDAIMGAADALTPAQRLAVLRPTRQEARWEGLPELYALCKNRWVHGRLSEEALWAYLRAILMSALPEADKRTICKSSQAGQTLAHLAVHGRQPCPGIAAAMVCAVLDASPERLREERLAALGVTPYEVFVALDGGSARYWQPRLEASVNR